MIAPAKRVAAPTASALQPPGFVVVELKEDREVTIGGPYDEATARSVAKLLKWAGAVARVEPAR